MTETKSVVPALDAKYTKAIAVAQVLRSQILQTWPTAVPLFDAALAAFNELYPSWIDADSELPLYDRIEITIREEFTRIQLLKDGYKHPTAAPEANKQPAEATPLPPAATPLAVADAINDVARTLATMRIDACITYARAVAEAEAGCAMALFKDVLAEVDGAEVDGAESVGR